jgi:hypothetical protein
MRKLLFGVAALPFLIGVASAAETLNDAQMDRVSAGATCPAGFTCTTSTSDNTTTTFGCLTGPNGCNGQIFTPTSRQTFFSDLNAFLAKVGYSSGCSTPNC